MQRAATALAVACAERLGRVYGCRVLLLVGRGDNGADALHAGARLARRGAAVSAVLLGEPVADALAAFRAAGGRVVAGARTAPTSSSTASSASAGGARCDRTPQPWPRRSHGCDVVAVDLPSGVDADTGEVAGAVVRADLTLVFGTCKPGLLVGAGRAAARAGGARRHRPRPGAAARARRAAAGRRRRALRLPRGHAGSDKYTRGVVGRRGRLADLPRRRRPVRRVGGARRRRHGALRRGAAPRRAGARCGGRRRS